MTNIHEEYFNYLYYSVYDRKARLSYRKLLSRLHETPFTYILDMDSNREEDGFDLRYRFGHDEGISDNKIAAYLDRRPCSVLEMMVALAIRCEEHIMENADVGDRTGQWFWNMIVNLDLGHMTDLRYDEAYVDEVVQRFLDRDYESNGAGGLFTVDDCRVDLRTVDIWYQLCWYLNSTYDE